MRINWQNNPILTTIKGTSAPIKNVKFPSVTFCSPGNMEIVTNASLFRMFYNFLGTDYGIKVDLSPLFVAETINLVVTKISDQYLQTIIVLAARRYSRVNSLFNQSFLIITIILFSLIYTSV